MNKKKDEIEISKSLCVLLPAELLVKRGGGVDVSTCKDHLSLVEAELGDRGRAGEK